MSAQPRLIDIDASNFDSFPCCGIKSPEHPGRVAKRCWLEANAKLGVRAKAIVAPDGGACGYIEYMPGEHAWRGIDAAGYMVIHCIWIHSRQYQGKGWGRLMVEACLEDAKGSGMKGVVALVRRGPWLADRRLFVSAGFEAVDSAPPDFELMVRKFDSRAVYPAFRKGWDERVKRYGRGLTIIRSNQCPYIVKFAGEIAETAAEEYGVAPTMIELKTWQDAQNAPTPYAVFAVIHDGRVLADHQISRTRFRNIMRRLP